MPEGLLIAGFPRIVSLPLEGKVPRRGGVMLRVNLYKERSPIKNHSRPLPLEGADERSEAGLASPHVKIPLREPTSAPSGHLLPKEGGRKAECIDW